jgi:hypothetical protein
LFYGKLAACCKPSVGAGIATLLGEAGCDGLRDGANDDLQAWEIRLSDGIQFHDSFIAHELDARASTTTITLIGPQANLVFV